MNEYWTVVKSPTKPGWYSLKSSERLSWLTDGFHMGNYKRKSDAETRAEALNNSRGLT